MNNSIQQSGVGTLIKAKRLDLNLSLREFAKKTGISSAVLSQLENDKIKTPSMKTISQIANILELPVVAVCSLYSMCSEDIEAKRETNELTSLQQLEIALTKYGVDGNNISNIISYIDFVISQQTSLSSSNNFERMQYCK